MREGTLDRGYSALAATASLQPAKDRDARLPPHTWEYFV